MSATLKKKVLLAVGGTGGHLFPAQALAHEMSAQLDILFAGAGLNNNRFFDRQAYRFKEVTSATPFKRNPLVACWMLLRGVCESLKLLKQEKPDLVVGFGSYHSFPLLVAAKLRRIPLVLFEADTFPGKVNRLFSSQALFTAVHFLQATAHLKGKTIPVVMPTRHQQSFDAHSQAQARQQLGLSPDCFTLLVFGGSQGAAAVNQQIPLVLSLMLEANLPVQLIHVTGQQKSAQEVHAFCLANAIAHYVVDFEKEMGKLWKAATVLIGRAGASTFSEMLTFEVPGILIPYPYASDGHQTSNAQLLEKEIKGGYCLMEDQMKSEALFTLLKNCQAQLGEHKSNMREYKRVHNKEHLGQLIYGILRIQQ